MQFASLYGECRQVVKAPGCGSGIRGFEPHHSPHFLKTALNELFLLIYLNCIISNIMYNYLSVTDKILYKLRYYWLLG